MHFWLFLLQMLMSVRLAGRVREIGSASTPSARSDATVCLAIEPPAWGGSAEVSGSQMGVRTGQLSTTETGSSVMLSQNLGNNLTEVLTHTAPSIMFDGYIKAAMFSPQFVPLSLSFSR